MMLGTPIVDITLDVDQSLSLGSLDSLDWTRLTPYSNVDWEDLGLPEANIVLSVSCEYGRDRFIVGDFQTGLATIVLNNDSGEWSPGSGVNNLGGNKLAPGQLVRIGFRFDADDVDDYLEAATGFTWNAGSDGPTRAPADDETVTGFVDGRTWTAHVDSPGDIDLNVITDPNARYGTVGAFALPSLTWPRFMGRIYSIEDRYEEGGQGAVTVVQCADLMADLALYNPGALGSARSAESVSGRWTYIWGQAINDGNMIGSSLGTIYDVESSDLPGNYLEEARVIARAEGGAIYADHGTNIGRLRLRHANWLVEDPRSATVQWAIGDTRLGITTAATDYSVGRVFNDLHYENSSTTVNVSDATSIAAHSTRSLRRTILNNDNTDLDTIADRDLALLKDSKLVITSVVIRPDSLFEQLFCADVSVGDLLDVTIVNKGWSYQQNLHVSGVRDRWDAATGDWTCTLRLDSREGDTVVS